jgi:hypothetical protein
LFESLGSTPNLNNVPTTTGKTSSFRKKIEESSQALVESEKQMKKGTGLTPIDPIPLAILSISRQLNKANRMADALESIPAKKRAKIIVQANTALSRAMRAVKLRGV